VHPQPIEHLHVGQSSPLANQHDVYAQHCLWIHAFCMVLGVLPGLFGVQALPMHFARLPAYHRFLDQLVDKRYKHRLLPVVQQGRGNDKKLALSPDYYAQVHGLSR